MDYIYIYILPFVSAAKLPMYPLSPIGVAANTILVSDQSMQEGDDKWKGTERHTPWCPSLQPDSPSSELKGGSRTLLIGVKCPGWVQENRRFSPRRMKTFVNSVLWPTHT